MAYEIIATSVTSGLVQRLGDIFPGAARYRETLPAQLMQYPHFFVHQLTADTQTERRNHLYISYLATIRYHEASDPVSITGSLQERLDIVSLKLLAELNQIYWDGWPVRINTPRTEKVDGVLHWFGNISVIAKLPAEPEVLQEHLNVNVSAAE